MPSSFGQYQSGIAPVSGISEAGARIGATYMAGVSALGQGLAEGIKSYSQSQQEREMLQGKIEGMAGNVQQLLQYANQSPENAAFVGSKSGEISSILEQAKNAPNMSLGALRGLASKVEMFHNNFAPEFQMFNYSKAQNEQSAAAEALNPKNNPLTEIVDKVVPMALKNFDASKAYVGNESEFSSALDNLEKQGINVDKPAKLEEYRKRVEEAATEMSKTNPMGLAILDQVKSARKLDEATSPDVEGYSEAEQAIRTPVASANTAEPENIKPYFNISDTEKELKEVQEKIKQYNIKLARDLGTQAPLGNETIGNTVEGIGGALGFGAKGLETNEALRTYIQGIKASNNLTGQISKSSIDSLVKDFYERNQGEMMSTYNLVNEAAKGFTLGGSSIAQYLNENLRGFRPLTSGEEQAIVDAARKIASQQSGYSTTDTLDRLKTREKQLQNNLLEQKGNQELINQTNETTANAPKPSQLALNPIDITVPKEEPVAPEVRNQRAIDFMTQRLGYRDSSGNLVTPASVNKIFGDMGMGGVKITNLPNGGQLVRVPNDKGGYDNHYQAPERVTQEQIDKQNAKIFGVVDSKTGSLKLAPIVQGSPFKFAGKFTGDEKELTKFKEINETGAMALGAIAQAEQIIKDHPVDMKNPLSANYARVKGLLAQAYGSAKETTGLSGIMTKYKLQFLQDVIPTPTSILETPSQSLAKITLLRQKYGTYIGNMATANGLKFYAPNEYLMPNLGDGKSTISSLKRELHK